MQQAPYYWAGTIKCLLQSLLQALLTVNGHLLLYCIASDPDHYSMHAALHQQQHAGKDPSLETAFTYSAPCQ